MYSNGKPWPVWYRRGPVDAQELLHKLAAEFGTTVCEIKGPLRVRELMGPRAVAARILRERGKSLPWIGRQLNRDHTSVANCIDKFAVYARYDPRVERAYHRWTA